MTPVGITAITVASAAGRGMEATRAALRDRRGGLRPCDFAEVRHGWVGRVAELETHTLPPEHAAFTCRNNLMADLGLRTDGFDRAVDDAVARYGPERIAVVLGTSTSGILTTEEAYRARGPDGALPAFDFGRTHDLHALACYVRAALGLRGPALTVSTACASSARSFVDAHHLMQAGVCDAAVVGGADTLCRLTLRGFACLDLVAPEPCRPSDANRQGLSIGEAAGFALLERRDAEIMLLGYGASSDGHHMSAPHPQGRGAIRAMHEALGRAGLAPSAIDYINLHGTGTPANDAMEDLAVASVFGSDTPCSSTKGWTGHTLGAAGIVEAAIAALCITHGFMPGGLNIGEVDRSFRANVLAENHSGPVRRVISNSFGFGGVNCSLVLGSG